MRYLGWFLKFVLFALVATFAVKNTDPVAVRYYFDAQWQAPLVLVLLLAFCAGAAAGLFAGLAQSFRQRRELNALRKEMQSIQNGTGTAGPPAGWSGAAR